MKKITMIIIAVFMALPMGVKAASYESFRTDLEVPYGFYKKSLGLTSKVENQEKATKIAEKFTKSWVMITAKYTQDIPEPFAELPDFAEKISRPAAVGNLALDLLKQGKVLEAHSVLEEVRYLLWEMRVVSGIISLNDRINDFHEAMEIVLDGLQEHSGDELISFGNRYGAWLTIKWEEVAATEDRGTSSKEFGKAVEDGRMAIDELRKAMKAGDMEGAKTYGKAVKNAYKAIFFMPECA